MINKKIIAATSALLLFSSLATGIVFAENSNPPSTNPTVLACVATAVAKREAAIQTAFTAFSDSWKAALQTRASELATAWTLTGRSARKEAVRNAWKKFEDAKKSARKIYNEARRSAWSTFTTERKACNSSATGENPGADTL